jgi:hypothetical protein
MRDKRATRTRRVNLCSTCHHQSERQYVVLRAGKREASRLPFVEVPPTRRLRVTRVRHYYTAVATGDQAVAHKSSSQAAIGTCPAVPTEWVA